MIVVCNGCPKSGSTWLVSIVMATGAFNPVPDSLQDPTWRNPSIGELDADGVKLLSMGSYFSKQHWNGDKAEFMDFARRDDVRMLNIVRDLRDVAVSRYFHDLRVRNFEGSLDEYMSPKRLRNQTTSTVNYHRSWHGTGKDAPLHLSSYEALIDNPDAQIQSILAYVLPDFPDSASTAAKIARETAFSTRKATGPGTHFRKGQPGDWVNHLSNEQDAQILEAAETAGWIEIKQRMIEQFPEIAPFISQTDLELA